MTDKKAPTLSAQPAIPTVATIEEQLRNARSTFEGAFKDFHMLIKDKVLKVNKSSAAKKLEKFTVDKLIKSCVALDQLNVGEGIMAMVVVALREHLAIRNRVNELEFELETMKRDFKRLNKELGREV